MNPTTYTVPHRARRAAAFSLIELLLVLVILAILTTLVVVNFAGKSEKAKLTKAAVDIKAMGVAIDSFNIDQGRFPKTDEGLAALITPIPEARDTSSWPYLTQDTLPEDPWGSPYQYRYPGEFNKSRYDVFSMGPDRQAGSEDDIGNWSARRP